VVGSVQQSIRLTKRSSGKPETQVLVAVRRRVPVAVRRPAVLAVVVPAAAAEHPARGPCDHLPGPIIAPNATPANGALASKHIYNMDKMSSLLAADYFARGAAPGPPFPCHRSRPSAAASGRRLRCAPLRCVRRPPASATGRDLLLIARRNSGKPETQVLVAVRRRAPVAVRRPAVLAVDVPAAAAEHPARGPDDKSSHHCHTLPCMSYSPNLLGG